MFLFRWILGLPFAGAVTIGLFLVMAQIIREEATLQPPKETPVFKITAEPRPEGNPEIKPPTTTIPENIPPTILEFPPVSGPGPVTVPPPGPATIERTPPDGGRFAGAIIKIPPPYPENCRSRGVEGIVVVEFDVTPEGNVSNPRVTSSPNACFNRSVIKAVSGWKYPPASGGGMRYGLVETFNFQLEG